MLGQLGDATQLDPAERSRRPSPMCLIERMGALSSILYNRATGLFSNKLTVDLGIVLNENAQHEL